MNLVSDGLTRVRNALLIGKNQVVIRKSNFVKSIFDVIESEGFVGSVEVLNDREISVSLKYDTFGVPVIRKMRIVSKPSSRMYLQKGDIPALKTKRFSVFVLSTSKGVMSDVEAYRQNIGGEVICEVY